MDVTMPIETYVTKLRVQNKQLYLKLLWKQNESDLFQIQIFDGDCSWSGRFSNDFAQKFRERDNIDENEEQYSANVKKCLIGDDENYTYDFASALDDSDTAMFCWKRRFKGVNVLHGKVPVHRDETNPDAKDTLIDILLQKNLDLKSNITGLQTETENLCSELEKCKTELEKYVNIKTSLETSLYGKFVQLLNTKKRRIQLLEDNLLKFEAGLSLPGGSRGAVHPGTES